jgi:lipopolysaccharide export system permease protein
MAAPKLVWRSVLLEVFIHTALGLGVIGLLLVVQNLLRYLEDLISVGLDIGDLARLLVHLLPTYLPYAIPTALLFGILVTFGRMSADGEVVALRASGVGIAQLLPPVIGAGILGSAILGALVFDVEPRARMQLKEFVRELGTSAKLATPGRFRSIGSRVLYVHSHGDESCPLGGVFIADFSRGEEPLYVSARCGAFRSEAEGPYLTLELTEGSVQLAPEEPETYRRLKFARMGTHLDLTRYLNPMPKSRDLTFRELVSTDAAFARGEGPVLRGGEGQREVRVQIHRRLAFSLSCVLLAALAVPLGVRPVRSGRSWGALSAIVLMSLYWFLLSSGQLAAESGRIPPSVGLWAGDLVVGVVAFVLIRRLRRAEV